MTEPPHGTVTLLFADIEGSTRLLQSLGDRYAGLLADYHRILSVTIEAHGGQQVDVAGDGVFAAFPAARAALSAAIDAQQGIRDHGWPDGERVAVRMGIHTGEPVSAEARYVGIDVHRAARICAAAHGGQVLVSAAARGLIGEQVPPGVSLRDLGDHRLKDLVHPERLYQLVAPGAPADFPPIRSLDTVPNNLPRQLSSFVGREREIAELTATLEESSLLSLTGPGGVGKTRLALQVAAGVAASYEDGAWFIELGALNDESLVQETVATALHVKPEPGTRPLEAVGERLEGRQTLLVLDNCEHVLDACAVLVLELLHRAPGLRVLATSREPLGIEGERLYPVPPMAVPDKQAAAIAPGGAASEAVRLFEERARAVLPSFGLTAANTDAVVQICRRLDGIPLAIELAAARVRMLPPAQIAARLDDRFRLLTGGSRTALPRHRTLRAALDWSFDLLTDVERSLLTRLSVFNGGFSVEAAEVVCGSGALDGADVLDLLAHLVDRSLIVAEELPGEARYRLLETIRHYAQDQLIESGEAERLHHRHRDWYLGLAEQARPAFLQGPEAAEWFERLDREHDNLRAALQWSLDDPESSDAALRIANSLWRYWGMRGHLVEGRGWLETVLQRIGAAAPEARAIALTGAGTLSSMQGDHEAAAAFLEESLILHRNLGNPRTIAYAANNLANVAIELGDFDRARLLYEESFTNAEAAGERRGSAMTLVNLADVAARTDHDEAHRLYERGIAIFREFDDQWSIAHATGRSAETFRRQGELNVALTRYGEALDIYRRLGDQRGVARTLQSIGEVCAEANDRSGAEGAFRDCLLIRSEIGDVAGTASSLERMAALVLEADPFRSARLLGAAQALRESVGAAQPAPDRQERERLIAGLRAALGSEAEAALAEGRMMSSATAVAYALQSKAVLQARPSGATSPPGPG